MKVTNQMFKQFNPVKPELQNNCQKMQFFLLNLLRNFKKKRNIILHTFVYFCYICYINLLIYMNYFFQERKIPVMT